jgi:NTE family protein
MAAGPPIEEDAMMKHVTPDVLKRDGGSDEAVKSELERTGTPPSAITEQRLPLDIPRRPRRPPKELGQIVLVL